MTARGRLLVFGGVFAIVVLLIAVVAIIGDDSRAGASHVSNGKDEQVDPTRLISENPLRPKFGDRAFPALR